MAREEIEAPDPSVTSKMKHGTYDKLDADGLCPPGGSRGVVGVEGAGGAVETNKRVLKADQGRWSCDWTCDLSAHGPLTPPRHRWDVVRC